MKKIIAFAFILLCVIAAPAFAVYDDATVVSVSKNSNDTVAIMANFTGAGETLAQRSIVLPWNYTDEQIAEWSVSTLEKLNGLKTIGTRIKVADKLPLVRPAKPVVAEEEVKP